MNPSFYLATTQKSVTHSPYGGIAYNSNYQIKKNPTYSFNINGIIPGRKLHEKKTDIEVTPAAEKSQYTLILKEGKYFIE